MVIRLKKVFLLALRASQWGTGDRHGAFGDQECEERGVANRGRALLCRTRIPPTGRRSKISPHSGSSFPPLNAGAFVRMTWTPPLPEVVFSHTPDQPNRSPLDDYQHFGEVDINGRSRELTVRLISTQGKVLYTKTLPAN